MLEPSFHGLNLGALPLVLLKSIVRFHFEGFIVVDFREYKKAMVIGLRLLQALLAGRVKP
jgi:hypothetical protein